MKIHFFNKEVVNQFCKISTGLITFDSFFLYFIDIDNDTKQTMLIILCILFFALYFLLWIRTKATKKIILKINTSNVEIGNGDIFFEDNALKVISFNEYFDTKVDDIVISKNSLNGQYIKKFYDNTIDTLDSIISSDTNLAKNIVSNNNNRSSGKHIKYKLGTICVAPDNYLLTALTHFDKDNKGYLTINDYIEFLFNFWKEIDKVYAGRTIVIPILGSGITRFIGYENITEQELLELIVWTFKVSHVKFTYPSKLKIVIYKGKSNQINLFRLKNFEN